ncbi:hypothetical protein BO86DRAFT_453747 [Aspergillus japonicus CBS 114.51]|uniref:Uncharacterized protein n=2 Tax=Aspergillus TaxID=5052 RepID=A0A2V5HHE5_ASPV1|nr:hypothetical protein BO86DRAFT_453747 [Aspergillus japonicus CBS 114.51]PYI15470.1 hypothetical protein BO99DRAFT_249735 [Aspergillus violaceofuscus CBS 115571]RAH85290.1 hypothetical protein BO86DRAFT_453747 [Aspergillus japonicus CBS 114.51]
MSEEQAHVQFEAEKEGMRPWAPHPHALPPRASTPHPAARPATVAKSTSAASKRAATTVTDGKGAPNPNPAPAPAPAATATDDEATPVQAVPLEATWAEHFAKHAETRPRRVRSKSIVRCQASTHHPGSYHYGDYALQADGAALEARRAVRAARSEGTCSPGSRLGSDYFTAPEDASEDSE